MNIEFYNQANDEFECYEAGQVVNMIGSSETYTCKSDDVLSKSKKLNLMGSFDNLQQFIQKLIKVDSFDSTIPILNVSVYGITPPANISNGHLFVSITTRPCSGSAVAYAGPFSFDDNNYRPIQGLINICPKYVPDSVVSYESEENWFFKIVFHELVHVLGLSHILFSKWLNRNTGEEWGEKFPLTQYTDPRFPNKHYSILHTPQCHKYASKRWKSEEFAPGVPMGIEIEDGGGSGTQGSHPESRISNGEVMCGIAQQKLVISDLVLSIIEDMGWYSVDFSYAKPLHWGDFSAFGEAQPNNLHKDPPQKAFPQHYFCSKEENNQYTCGYDYRTVALCPLSPKNCPGSTSEEKLFCSEQGFYNPLNKSYYGDSRFDYMPIKIEALNLINNHFCFRAESKIPNEVPSFLVKQVICSSQNNSYNVTVFGKSYYCDHDSKEFFFDESNPMYTSFKCSSPKIICEGLAFDKKEIPQPSRVPFPDDKVPLKTPAETPLKTINDKSDGSNANTKKPYLNMIIYGCIFIFVCLAAVVIIKKIKSTHADEESGAFTHF